MMRVILLLMCLAVPVLARDSATRTVTGQGVRFSIPAGAERGRFTQIEDGAWRYKVKTNVRGLGSLSVTVEARGDPEATLKNELIGVEANARSKHMRRSRAHVVDVNRSKGGEALESTDGQSIAHLTTWSARRQFSLALEGSAPMDHAVWKALVKSFRSDEAPLK